MKKRISEIMGALLILLFAYTATSKLFAFHRFESVLRSAPLIGYHARLFAALIPAVEWVVVLLLLQPLSRKSGLIASGLVLIVFTVYMAFMVFTDPSLPCSCGGVIQQLSWKQHIVFNLLFIAIAAAGIAAERRNKIREVL